MFIYFFNIIMKILFYYINSDIIQREIREIILKYNIILHKMKKEINLYFIFHTFL